MGVSKDRPLPLLQPSYCITTSPRYILFSVILYQQWLCGLGPVGHWGSGLESRLRHECIIYCLPEQWYPWVVKARGGGEWNIGLTLAHRLGRHIAQAVSSWLPTPAARVLSQFRSRGICGGQSIIGACFLRVFRFHLASSHSTDFTLPILVFF
jgi:hypothetical protein